MEEIVVECPSRPLRCQIPTPLRTRSSGLSPVAADDDKRHSAVLQHSPRVLQHLPAVAPSSTNAQEVAPRVGDLVSGQVKGVERSGIIVQLAGPYLGWLPQARLRGLRVALGEQIHVSVAAWDRSWNWVWLELVPRRSSTQLAHLMMHAEPVR